MNKLIFIFSLLDMETIQNIYDKMKLLYDRVLRAQNNVKALVSNIEVWSCEPLFERKDGKKETLLGLDDRVERVNKRYEQIGASAQEANKTLDINYKLFFNLPIPEDTPEDEEEVCQKYKDNTH